LRARWSGSTCGGSASNTKGFDAEHPYGATEADHGEPGYLDKPRKGGGGGGRKSTQGRMAQPPPSRSLPRHPCPRSSPPPCPRHRAAATEDLRSPATLDEILADPFVDAELKRAFRGIESQCAQCGRTVSLASLKKEQGGWVVWNKDTGELEVVRVPPGTRDGLGTIVGTRPPTNDHQQTVGWFHTHPNKAEEGFGSDPSDGDTGFQNGEAKVPGIIETHDGRKTMPFPERRWLLALACAAMPIALPSAAQAAAPSRPRPH
jgi:hypothetical protein